MHKTNNMSLTGAAVVLATSLVAAQDSDSYRRHSGYHGNSDTSIVFWIFFWFAFFVCIVALFAGSYHYHYHTRRTVTIERVGDKEIRTIDTVEVPDKNPGYNWYL